MRGQSSPLLGLELGLERRELGKRRIGIGLALAPIASIAAFDVLGSQLGIAIRTVATIALRTIAARRPALVALLWAIWSLGTLLGPLGTLLRARRMLGTLLGPVATTALPTFTTMMATMPAMMLASATLARLGGAGFRRRSGRRTLCGHWSLAATMRLRLAVRPALLALKASTRTPDLDKIGLLRLCRCRLDFGRLGLGARTVRRLHRSRYRLCASGGRLYASRSRIGGRFGRGLGRRFDRLLGLGERHHLGGGYLSGGCFSVGCFSGRCFSSKCFG
jgi:hypothetical protein